MQAEINKALALEENAEYIDSGALPSCFAVTNLAALSIGAIGSAIVELASALKLSQYKSSVTVDKRLASLWFRFSLTPLDWQFPAVWDAIAGNYETSDGWIKLHTNLPKHKAAALSVLGNYSTKESLAREVRNYAKDELETLIVNAGGASAAMHTRSEWLQHPQGVAVATEPLIAWEQSAIGNVATWNPSIERPLAGLRVLDLTRILAGPIATRTLAGFGADVLRIDPPAWQEPLLEPEITIGKRCARLDLTKTEDRHRFLDLLKEAHLLVHGYRPNALEKLGLGEDIRRNSSPDHIEITLNAYGWTGPWSKRRGFDSLVQMSTGIADTGMHWKEANKPTPLPVQALDYATGYLMAASCIKALTHSVENKGVWSAKLSLARTAELLATSRQLNTGTLNETITEHDQDPSLELTPWGKGRRLKSPLSIEHIPMIWSSPACKLGSAIPAWSS